MRNIILLLIVLLITSLSYSQHNQTKGINYKALIKDENNNALSNQNITIVFSILEGPEIEFTDIIYAETHTTNTDANGIVIVNIGEGDPLSGFEDFYDQIEWGSGFGSHYLKVQIDSGSGLTDIGTTEFKAVPYALFAKKTNDTGLELINEGNGNGYRFIGRNPDSYGPIANGAIDLSISFGPSNTKGATGNYATAIGYNTTASGQSSFASGVGTTASQAQATAMGAGTVASGHSSTALGIGTRAEAPNSTAIGLYNVGGGDPLLASSTDPLFEIGNGNYIDGTNDNRTNALTVLRNGTITAPSFDISEIINDKALITKEYADANYSGGSGVSSGLEAIDEGNGIGWRLIGKDPSYYDTIGENAVDLSTNPDVTLNLGATGTSNFTAGYKTKASNLASTALGNLTIASGFSSTSMGFETIADDQFSTVVGRLNDNTTSTNILFQVGNGSSGGRSNAFSVNYDGLITAPSFDISEIIDPKALITKEYADANFGGGLEAIDEGNGFGYRIKGRDPNNYGNIGLNAIDLSTSTAASSNYGALGNRAFAAGSATTASGTHSTALGFSTEATGAGSTAMGAQSIASGVNSIAAGFDPRAYGITAVALGTSTRASGDYSLATGNNSSASMESSTALGANTIANANFATALGANTTASGIASTAMGNLSTASGLYSTAMGTNTNATGDFSTATGVGTTAHGQYSLASGYLTIANGNYTSAFGHSTNAYGHYSSAFGNLTQANADYSTTMGIGTISDTPSSLVIGEYNDVYSDVLFQIGNGTGDGTGSTFRANAMTVYTNGHILAWSYDLVSDKRLKSNISELNYGLNTILKLNPVTYNWKKHPEQIEKTLGLIAQEVKPLINEIVNIGNDENKTLSINYTELIPVLIKAIQEQQTIINNQDKQIKNLSSELIQFNELDQRLKKLEALNNTQQ